MRCLPTTTLNFFNVSICGVFLSGCPTAISLSPALATENSQKAVIELFTSQGCSSCPPADALLSQLAKRNDIVALTLPVNYWDHLGWKDTLAREAYAERQRAYAASRGDHEIYTPQLIVNGVVHVVGSSPSAIEDALRRTDNALKKVRVPVFLAYQHGAVELRAGSVPDGSDYRSGILWLACFSQMVPVEIRRGENNGHRVTYTNVVRSLTQAAHWTGQEITVRVSLSHDANVDGCAAFLQAEQSKAILGVAIKPRFDN